MKKRPEMFWARHIKKQGSDFCSSDFKNLFNAMVHPDPALRPNVLELLAHKWI
jgi:hypothetical protein